MVFFGDVDEKKERSRIFRYNSGMTINGRRRDDDHRKRDTADYNNVEINTTIMWK